MAKGGAWQKTPPPPPPVTGNGRFLQSSNVAARRLYCMSLTPTSVCSGIVHMPCTCLQVDVLRGSWTACSTSAAWAEASPAASSLGIVRRRGLFEMASLSRRKPTAPGKCRGPDTGHEWWRLGATWISFSNHVAWMTCIQRRNWDPRELRTHLLFSVFFFFYLVLIIYQATQRIE